MQQVLKTTTAIAMILSLLMPTVTMAQEATPEEAAPQAEVNPLKKAAEEAAAAVKEEVEAAIPEAAKEAAKPEAVPEAAEAPAEKPAEAPAEPVAEKPPAAPEAAAEPAPEPGPEAVVTEKPQAKPETVEAPAPEAKPEDAPARAQKAEAVAEEAEKKPVPAKRDQPEAEAPAAKPAEAADPAEASAPEKAATPAEAPAPEAAAGTDAEALKKALEEKAAPEAKPAEPAAEAAKAEAAPETAAEKPAGEDADALKKALAEQEKAAQTAVTAETAAPEANAKEDAAAIAAANPEKVTPNEALKALEDKAEAKGEVSEVTVSKDDARRSDQDFTTSVSQNLVAAAKGESEAKKKDDDKGRDLAKLALAGLAGYAVGTMLSNNREVALNTGDRVVVTMPDGSQQLIKNDDALLFQPGSNVQTQKFEDGSTITTVLREDGSKVVTIRDANMNVLRRAVQWPDGRQTMLIDDTVAVEPVRVSELPPAARPVTYENGMSESALREALMQESRVNRHFTLDQIRDIAQVRALVAPLDIQSITFETGSAAVQPSQAEQLAALGRVIAGSIKDNPRELYLIEGYTDAVGSAASNLALSDRRAESVALALSEYFKVPPENLVVQGYGESFLRIQTDGAERANRRVAIRRITDLIEQR